MQGVIDKRGPCPSCGPKDLVWVLVLCVWLHRCLQNATEMHSVLCWRHWAFGRTDKLQPQRCCCEQCPPGDVRRVTLDKELPALPITSGLQGTWGFKSC